MEKYYIYHLPHFIWKDGSVGKIGVSEKPKGRAKKQGFTEYEILEEHTCIYKVSYREKELQKEYGYKVDAILYYQTRLNQSFEGCSKGGKKGGKTGKGGKIGGPISGRIAVETGQIKIIASKGGISSCSIIKKCPYCNTESNSPVIYRWHFDNCKHKT